MKKEEKTKKGSFFFFFARTEKNAGNKNLEKSQKFCASFFGQSPSRTLA